MRDRQKAPGRSAIVTGAASGIGLATAQRLAGDGWSVVCVDRNQVALDRVVDQLIEVGGKACAVAGDVALRETHQTATAAAIELGSLRAWVGVAGLATDYDLLTVDETEVRQLIDVNQLGILWGAIAAVEQWSATSSPGTVVITSSVHASHAARNSGIYEMTKAAVEALARNIAVTYGRLGIRAVAVAPGAIATPALVASLNSASNPGAAKAHLARHAPLSRLGEATEIAGAIAFLVSDDASYISGTTLTVDGGMSAVLMLPSQDDSARRS